MIGKSIHLCHGMHEESEDSLQQSALSFYPVGSRIELSRCLTEALRSELGYWGLASKHSHSRAVSPGLTRGNLSSLK